MSDNTKCEECGKEEDKCDCTVETFTSYLNPLDSVNPFASLSPYNTVYRIKKKKKKESDSNESNL